MRLGTWKRDAASGLIVLVPLLVTTWVVLWLYGNLNSVPLIREAIRPELFGGNVLGAEIARVILTLVAFAVLVLAIGYAMRTAFGRVIEDVLDDWINRVPILRMVYNASKMAVETALGGAENLQRPVRLEPWEGMRMTAFKTGRQTQDGREVLFLPTAPNITTGFVVEVEADRFEETNERVEDALTRVISAGFAENDSGAAADLLGEDAADQSAETGSGQDGSPESGSGSEN